jgi:tripartite-type tricarboxylate transporter receptor subunit TctC
MIMRFMRVLLYLGLAISAGPAQAQATVVWPAAPVRWVVPFAPGGPTDVVARVVGSRLSERIGQAVLIESHPGAAGNIGTEMVARARPDGQTILFVVPAIVTNPAFFKASIPHDQLAPVIQLDWGLNVLVTNPAFPVKTVPEVVALIKAKPGAVSCGVTGSLYTVGCALLQLHAGAEVIMVPYKGQGPALNALIAGEINVLFDGVITSLAQAKAGRIRAIASTNPKRGRGPFGELPVVAESLPGFDLVAWQGVMSPRATPAATLQRMNREMNAVLEQLDIRQRLSDSGMEVAGGTPEALGELLKRESALYEKVLKDAGIRPE